MKKAWVLPAAVTVSLVTGAVGGAVYGPKLLSEQIAENPVQKKEEEGVQLTKVEKAFELISKHYVEEVDEGELEEGAIQGMLETLKDPYSVYMDKETAKQFNDSLDSSFEGIGTEIGMEDGKIIIVSPYKNSPAEKAGLKPKDQLLKVNGESLEGLDLFETSMKIRGKKGTKVTIEVKRAGVSDPIKLEVVRDEIPIETVHKSIKEENGKNIGYLEITSFSQNTSKDFKKSLKELEEQNITGLLIDVRGNPGGLLDSVQEMLALLIPSDKPYLLIEERNGDRQEFYTNLKEKKPYPIAVLIDKGSASASEIMAGALAEAGGYPLIGEKTFGKGTVQQAVPMGDGSNIKLTLFKWLTPDGNWIHKKGIKPTIEVHQPAIFSSHPLNVEKTFKRDMTHEQIENAQSMLRGLGYQTSRQDGYFDLKTEIAIKAFQKQNGLKATGVLDKKTAAALENTVLSRVNDEEYDVQLKAAIRYLSSK
ncbi:S41 family peptidase [Peribacillus alkalitolerans]|uniref:S41 family peptidase n=1 Tax=Peribacillus alkalitolerans TaxID=1550385 RepID=UPI0013D3D30B|nr:S41 family peptidase [Peribacillus alkalitolerans]